MFEEHYKTMLTRTDKLYYNYFGINRKDFPKWQGWKIIASYKENGVGVKQIKDKRLDILVKNFYYLKYLKAQFEYEYL